jgi:hypothetical protein
MVSFYVAMVASVPMLTGAPATSITAAHYYAFQPAASGARKALTFAITNKPAWAQFDASTGRLFGTPLPQANIGTYANILISGTDGSTRAYLAPFAITVLPLPNTPPSIGGTPAAAVAPGQAYSFQPTARDPNGLRLAFVIGNKPTWASFDATTGRLSGTPSAANAGTYSNITIAVYDGYQKAVLAPFSIAVKGTAAGGKPPVVTPPPTSVPQTTGSATLVWQPPTQTTNGTTLTNLAGYRIHYGTTANNLAQTITVANPGVSRYVVSGLTTATWYFQMTAYDMNGMESPPTAVASVVMQ